MDFPETEQAPRTPAEEQVKEGDADTGVVSSSEAEPTSEAEVTSEAETTEAAPETPEVNADGDSSGEDERSATATEVPEEDAAEARSAEDAEPAESTEASESTASESEEVLPDELLPEDNPIVVPMPVADAELKAVLEAIIYVTDEPLTLDQICAGIEQPRERVIPLLEELSADYEQDSRGLTIKEIASGFKMATKPEHHEAVRRFVKNLNPPLKLSLPALETLAVIAYKQPITAPEIMEIRGVQGAGVLKTLIDRKLIATGGRKQVVGKPILYKTTREFLVQFGLRDLAELPTLKEFQDIGRMDTDSGAPAEVQHTPSPSEPLLFSTQIHDEPERQSMEPQAVEPRSPEPQAPEFTPAETGKEEEVQ